MNIEKKTDGEWRTMLAALGCETVSVTRKLLVFANQNRREISQDENERWKWVLNQLLVILLLLQRS